MKNHLLALTLFAAACSDAGRSGERDAGTTDTATDTVGDVVLHVDAAAAPGGDGSPAHPFDSLAAVLDAAPWGANTALEVRVAAGDYSLPAALPGVATLRLYGSGAGVTRLDGAADWATLVELQLADVAISGGIAASAPTLVVSGVEVEGDMSLAAGEGGVSLDGALLRDGVAALSGEVRMAHVSGERVAMRLDGGGHVEDLDLRDADGPALVLSSGEFDLRAVEVADTGERVTVDTGDVGVAVIVEQGASASFDGLLVFRSASRSLLVRGGEATVTQGTFAGAGNTLVSAQDGAAVVLEDSDLGDASVLLFAVGSRLRVSRVVGERARNAALLADGGADVTIVSSTFTDCDNGFLSVLGEETTVEIRDNVFDTARLEACIALSSVGGTATVEGNTIRGCATAAVSVLGSADVHVVDNEIVGVVGVGPPPFADLAEGVTVTDSFVEVRGNAISGAEGAGVALLRADGSVENNVIWEPGDVGVRAVEPREDVVAITGNTVAGATGAGIAVFSRDARVVGNTVEDTLVSTRDGFGDGVVFAVGGQVDVVDNTIRGSAIHGIRYADGVSGTVQGNRITGSVGAAVHEDCWGAETAVTVGPNDLVDNGADVEACP